MAKRYLLCQKDLKLDTAEPRHYSQRLKRAAQPHNPDAVPEVFSRLHVPKTTQEPVSKAGRTASLIHSLVMVTNEYRPNDG